MRVLGIDPGTISTGLGLVALENGKERAEFVGTIFVQRKLSLPERLKEIYAHLRKVVEKQNPTVVAIETCFYHKDVHAAVKLGEARALALLIAAEAGVEIVEYPPARVKQAICGNGRASKEQIQYMVRQLLHLDRDPQPDAADALAIALCHAYCAGKHPLLQKHK
ncbi:MAG: crossover junction endodeoxyribonuclease RuvC [Candidatus Omnitrophica bacterium]|nr:crossover junction endodeoxyribonuclease RuvC [Candidatus Omnitrophota bacterium]